MVRRSVPLQLQLCDNLVSGVLLCFANKRTASFVEYDSDNLARTVWEAIPTDTRTPHHLVGSGVLEAYIYYIHTATVQSITAVGRSSPGQARPAHHHPHPPPVAVFMKAGEGEVEPSPALQILGSPSLPIEAACKTGVPSPTDAAKSPDDALALPLMVIDRPAPARHGIASG